MADNSSGSSAVIIVAILAVVVIAFLAFFFLRGAAGTNAGPGVNVTLPTPTDGGGQQ